MSLKLFKRKTRKGYVWAYRGKVGEDYLRGTTSTAIKAEAARIATEVERKHLQRGRAGSQDLTFPEAVVLYEKAGKGQGRQDKLYITRLLQYWKDARVRDMTAGAIRQSAIDIHPNDSGATRNRQVITPTQAIINHCAELEKCPPIRVKKRFKFVAKKKKPVVLDWLDTFCAHADPLNAALALTMFGVGCRISEARRIEWSDIDFAARTVTIHDHKTQKDRIAHMPPRLLVALANLPRDRAPFGYPETSMRRAWDKVIAAAAEAQEGFVRLTFHSCRHGLATALLRKGVDPRTAADLVGMSVQVLISTYAHEIGDATMTNKVFDGTPAARDDDRSEQDQQVRRK